MNEDLLKSVNGDLIRLCERQVFIKGINQALHILLSVAQVW
jgi:hypothetical protein